MSLRSLLLSYRRRVEVLERQKAKKEAGLNWNGGSQKKNALRYEWFKAKTSTRELEEWRYGVTNPRDDSKTLYRVVMVDIRSGHVISKSEHGFYREHSSLEAAKAFFEA